MSIPERETILLSAVSRPHRIFSHTTLEVRPVQHNLSLSCPLASGGASYYCFSVDLVALVSPLHESTDFGLTIPRIR